MQQIMSVWNALDIRRRIFVGLATVAMFVAVLALSGMATKPGMSLLYSGLEPGPAGDVLLALDQRNVEYDVRGGAIFVNSTLRDELRMSLASEGLPANNSDGYELLDSLSGFGTTSQMFDAAYWRAKEGELARTIVASPHIRTTRVHISNPSSQPFRRDLKPTASVTVTAVSGAFPASHARALRYLVASAVAGLLPEDVSVIDGVNGQVLGLEDAVSVNGNNEGHTTDLRQAVERILEARVGRGNVVVEISVETETDRETIVERRFDPNGRVAISSETEERTTSTKDAGGGSVTVASNLPGGEAAGSDSSSTSQDSETRERINFEVSETQTETLRAPGAIKRLTVAVLINGATNNDATDNEDFAPRSEEELAALRELVASAVGFDELRGDVITVKSMVFEPISDTATLSDVSTSKGLNLDATSLIQTAVLALVLLVLGFFVVRPILKAPPAIGRAGVPPQRTLAAANAIVSARPAGHDQSSSVLIGQIDENDAPPQQMALVPSEETANSPNLSTESENRADPDQDPVKRLRALIEERQEETVEILRNWMEEEHA